MKDGYTNIKNKVFLSKNLTPSEKLILCCLEMFMFDKNECYPSLNLLSEISGLDRKTVIKATAGLASKRFYKIDKLQGRKNLYKRNY